MTLRRIFCSERTSRKHVISVTKCVCREINLDLEMELLIQFDKMHLTVGKKIRIWLRNLCIENGDINSGLVDFSRFFFSFFLFFGHAHGLDPWVLIRLLPLALYARLKEMYGDFFFFFFKFKEKREVKRLKNKSLRKD